MLRSICRLSNNLCTYQSRRFLSKKYTATDEWFLEENDYVKIGLSQKAVDELFQPDISGCSPWVAREDIANHDKLNWGNNGNGRHGVYFGDNRYVWEKQTTKCRISALRTIGFNEDVLYGANRPIRDDIHKIIKSKPCVVCGSKSHLVTDHKNDLYNDLRVLNSKTQILDDFQCLCNHCNLQKRQISKQTKIEKKRYGATNIPHLAVLILILLVAMKHLIPMTQMLW